VNKHTASTLAEAERPYKIIRGPSINPYQERVVRAYGDSPDDWRKAIGNALWFQFGVYDDTCSAPPLTLDESGKRYFERQLKLAGLAPTEKPTINRILDVGCGWGTALRYMAEHFPDCQHLDGVNISGRQLQHSAKLHIKQGLSKRIHLYQCNAHDIDLLPDLDSLYDVVIMRGVISHFPNDLYETVMKKLWQRMATGGTIIISDNLYNVALDKYTSDIPDLVDRLACQHRKTADYFSSVLERSKFTIQDIRVLPSNADAVHWLLDIKSNIEQHFPNGITGALEELHVMCESLAVALVKNKLSIYSTIAKRF
jgi:cyclopropane fatty-acyl-phospholipid synthase-like methyltransferase